MERSDKGGLEGSETVGRARLWGVKRWQASLYCKSKGLKFDDEIFDRADWFNSENYVKAFKYLLDDSRPRRMGSAGEALEYLEGLTEFEAGLVAEGHRRDEALNLSRQMREAERASLPELEVFVDSKLTGPLFSDPIGTIINHYPIGQTLRILASIPAISDRFCADLNRLAQYGKESEDKLGVIDLIATVLTQIYCRILFKELLLHTTEESQREALKKEKIRYKPSTVSGPYRRAEGISYVVWDSYAGQVHLVKCLAECPAISKNDIVCLSGLYNDAQEVARYLDYQREDSSGVEQKFERTVSKVLAAKKSSDDQRNIVRKFRDHFGAFLWHLDVKTAKFYTEVDKQTNIDFHCTAYYNANSFDLAQICRLMDDVGYLHQAAPDKFASVSSIQRQG